MASKATKATKVLGTIVTVPGGGGKPTAYYIHPRDAEHNVIFGPKHPLGDKDWGSWDAAKGALRDYYAKFAA